MAIAAASKDLGERLLPETRVRMHISMLRIRRIEEAIARRYGEGEIRCPTHLCIGQEAIAVGISAHLRPDDLAFSGHRSHGHYLAKGGDLAAMVAELYGRETGCAKGRGGSQHLIDMEAGFVASAPILAGTIPIAVGAAFGAKHQGRDTVSIVYFGDGATEEGTFHEAMNYASVHQLPVIFVCENNLYSVHSEMAVRQPPHRPIAAFGKAHGMPSVGADGNDINLVWQVGADAVHRARRGGGPTLIEFTTYRWLEHCGPGDDLKLGYRSREEHAAWLARCPIRRSEAELRRDGVLDSGQISAIESDINAEVDAAIANARAAAFPQASSFSDFTFPA